MTKQKRVSLLKIIAMALAFMLVISVSVGVFCKVLLENIYPQNYTEYIDKYCEQYSVPKDLIYATIKTESGFDENAQSEAGAIGLTQITPETFLWLMTKTGESYVEEDLKNPEISIKYCVIFYSLLLNEFSSTRTAVAAYHAGRTQVNLWLADSRYSADGVNLTSIPSKATGHYVSKVISAINIYNNLYKEEL